MTDPQMLEALCEALRTIEATVRDLPWDHDLAQAERDLRGVEREPRRRVGDRAAKRGT